MSKLRWFCSDIVQLRHHNETGERGINRRFLSMGL
jgi:hypothetical protein